MIILMNKIMLVDGMALLFRGYFATAYRRNFMRTKSGQPTNGIFQFLVYFLDAVETFRPSHVICCWDLGRKTFRTDLYADYKANRDAPPEELVPQFELVKTVVETLGVPNISLENYEADDCIGTIARSLDSDVETIILTGDLDLLQLVSEQTNVAIMRKGVGNYEVFTQNNFYDKQGLIPEQMIDFKALVGDPADHYPGIKGIGEVTARKLLQTYNSIENILLNIDQLSEAMQKRLQNDQHLLETFQTLAKIKCDLSINFSLEEAKWAPVSAEIAKKLGALELDHLVSLINNG